MSILKGEMPFKMHNIIFFVRKKNVCATQHNLQGFSYLSKVGVLVQACPGNIVVGWSDGPNMTIAVDWDVKQQTNKQILLHVSTLLRPRRKKICVVQIT